MPDITYSYDTITASTLRTITDIAAQARGAAPVDPDACWAMARGAFRAWCELVGDAATEQDRATLEQLFEGIPLRDPSCLETAPGNWRPSPIVVLAPAAPR
ncbi:hypothetical protein [Pseudoduganella armeniaca]|uniref:Uncharacterized protein n=1 Tax=Pseudoduganella armeniaca TaxID=2072590 RepID=A0A2R4CAS9_9BURK|nr:hypothetical protein [Pseudoduganella armeniaca]AVR96610.1 hypothetical protein C9I28_13605 [Pseudoduganella armeniaca]